MNSCKSFWWSYYVTTITNLESSLPWLTWWVFVIVTILICVTLAACRSLHFCFLLNLVFNLHIQGFLSSASIFLWMFLSSASIFLWMFLFSVSFPTDMLVLCHFLLIFLSSVSISYWYACPVSISYGHSSLCGPQLDAALKRLHTEDNNKVTAQLTMDVSGSLAAIQLLKRLGFHFQARGGHLMSPYIVFPHWNTDDLLIPSYDALRALAGDIFFYLLLLRWCFSLLGYSLSGTTCW